jgi:DNA-binding GntR family transcriptional regulator
MPRESLVPQIMQHLLDHFRNEDMAAGQHLGAQKLADTFRVSRAPVVGALKKLEDLGIVRAEPNRGFFLAVDAANLRDMPDQNSPEESLYFRIAEDRLSDRLPDRFSESVLMRRYGVARGRLVRVLQQMAEEGLVDRLPGNGWEFRETLSSLKAYGEAYQFRAAIEMQALLLPSFAPDPEAFAAARQHQLDLLSGFQGASLTTIYGTNIEFHEMLMRCANNAFFLDAVRRVNRVRRLIEYRIGNDRERLPQQCREHLQILDLIEARDMQAAATFLFHHVREAGNIKVRLLEQHRI